MKLIATLAIVILLASAAGVGTAGAEPLSEASVSARNTLELPIVRELNRVRSMYGLSRLRTDSSLRAAADLHAGAMARGGFFSHASRDGGRFYDRIGHFYTAAGFRTWSVGENLLWSGARDLSAERAVALWMASPGHRRNILTPRWRQIGISAVRAQQPSGAFVGSDEVIIVVTDFGARS